MTVLGKGTFGCVVSPPLNCTDSSIKPGKRVSKIMYDKEALDEMKEYEALDKIPELKKYLLQFPEQCNPVNDEKFHKAIKQCNHIRLNHVYRKQTTKNIGSLLLENGGVSLKDFQRKFGGKLTVNDFEIFLTSIKDLFESLIILRKHEYVHQDIKAKNILYSPKTGKIALIDFGKLTTFKKIKEGCEKSTHQEGRSWDNYPPESKFMNRDKKLLKFESDYQEFLKMTITTWDSYSLALCLKETFENFSRWIQTYSIREVVKDADKQKEIQIKNFIIKATSLLEPFIQLRQLDNSELMDSIRNSDILRDSDIESFKFKYIELLKDYKLYRVSTPKPSKKVIQIEQDSSVQHMVDNIAEKKCKEGKEPHPISNRCVKKCNKGEQRDSSGKCTSKSKPKHRTRKTVKKKTKSIPTNSEPKQTKSSPTNSEPKQTKSSPKDSEPKYYKINAYIDKNEYEIYTKL